MTDISFGHKLGRRRLGRTELMVPALALGGAGLGSGEISDEDAIEAVRYAVQQDICFIDTSPLYGHSERRIGLALEEVPRQNLILSSKAGTHPQRRGDYSREAILWSVENSLKMLKTSFIDVLLVHDPHDIEPVFAPRGALEALEELKSQGVIGCIGLGQRRHDFHRRALASGRFDVILTYSDYNPLSTTAVPLLEEAAHRDAGVLNGAPLLMGLLTGQNPDEIPHVQRGHVPPRDVDKVRRLYAWCREREVSMQAVAFQFCLRQPLIHCTLTGAKTRAELEENLHAATTPLPEGTWDELAALNLLDADFIGEN